MDDLRLVGRGAGGEEVAEGGLRTEAGHQARLRSLLVGGHGEPRQFDRSNFQHEQTDASLRRRVVGGTQEGESRGTAERLEGRLHDVEGFAGCARRSPRRREPADVLEEDCARPEAAREAHELSEERPEGIGEREKLASRADRLAGRASGEEVRPPRHAGMGGGGRPRSGRGRPRQHTALRPVGPSGSGNRDARGLVEEQRGDAESGPLETRVEASSAGKERDFASSRTRSAHAWRIIRVGGTAPLRTVRRASRARDRCRRERPRRRCAAVRARGVPDGPRPPPTGSARSG